MCLQFFNNFLLFRSASSRRSNTDIRMTCEKYSIEERGQLNTLSYRIFISMFSAV